MKIPHSCAFIVLSASYDNVNPAPYLHTFFPRKDIKHVEVCGSSAKNNAKIRYVYARSCVCMRASFSLRSHYGSLYLGKQDVFRLHSS